MSEVITGPLWAARNWSIDAGEGSIHDDATAEELGFRGGTVAGDVHMNQFPPVLVGIFGNDWFERGNLSLNFKNATVDLERVQVFAEPLVAGEHQTRVWMEREDGLLVCAGTAALGDHSCSELQEKDLRPCDPAELRILNRLRAGMSLGSYDVFAAPDKQFERYDTRVISDPMPWYRETSPWDGVVAAPCTILEFLWAYPMQGMQPYIGEAVGLFGAIEIGFINGPFLLNLDYRIESEVVCVGQSPQTEYVWYDSTAYNEAGEVVATMRMQSRVMKASSPAYQA
jgi:hypothetical protein